MPSFSKEEFVFATAVNTCMNFSVTVYCTSVSVHCVFHSGSLYHIYLLPAFGEIIYVYIHVHMLFCSESLDSSDDCFELCKCTISCFTNK